MKKGNTIAEKDDMPILYSCHPRSKKRIETTGFQLDKRVIQHEPLGFHDYNCLQMNAFAVISDSGILPEQSLSTGNLSVSIILHSRVQFLPPLCPVLVYHFGQKCLWGILSRKLDFICQISYGLVKNCICYKFRHNIA